MEKLHRRLPRSQSSTGWTTLHRINTCLSGLIHRAMMFLIGNECSMNVLYKNRSEREFPVGTYCLQVGQDKRQAIEHVRCVDCKHLNATVHEFLPSSAYSLCLVFPRNLITAVFVRFVQGVHNSIQRTNYSNGRRTLNDQPRGVGV